VITALSDIATQGPPPLTFVQSDHVVVVFLTKLSKVEQRRQILAIGKFCVGLPDLIKEWVNHCFNRREPFRWSVLQEVRNEIQSLWRGFCAEDL